MRVEVKLQMQKLGKLIQFALVLEGYAQGSEGTDLSPMRKENSDPIHLCDIMEGQKKMSLELQGQTIYIKDLQGGTGSTLHLATSTGDFRFFHMSWPFTTSPVIVRYSIFKGPETSIEIPFGQSESLPAIAVPSRNEDTVLITVLHFVNNAIHVGFMTGDSSHLTVPRVFRRTNATTGS